MPNGHRGPMNRKTRTVGRIGSPIEISAEYEHTITLTTKLTNVEGSYLSSALEGALAFLLQSKEPLNPNADCFKDPGLAIMLDFVQGVINACDLDDEDDERQEYTVDDYVERWEEEGPKKGKKSKRKRG